MGLDMYLNKRTYIGAEYKHREAVVYLSIKIKNRPIAIDGKKVSYIEESCMY